jgi:cytochrome bd-type quinol oxidase subunit 1
MSIASSIIIGRGSFGVNFAMRGVSGLSTAYQFGTNWSYFSGVAVRFLRSNQQGFADA